MLALLACCTVLGFLLVGGLLGSQWTVARCSCVSKIEMHAAQ
jgi:hypothetical protein